MGLCSHKHSLCCSGETAVACGESAGSSPGGSAGNPRARRSRWDVAVFQRAVLADRRTTGSLPHPRDAALGALCILTWQEGKTPSAQMERVGKAGVQHPSSAPQSRSGAAREHLPRLERSSCSDRHSARRALPGGDKIFSLSIIPCLLLQERSFLFG